MVLGGSEGDDIGRDAFIWAEWLVKGVNCWGMGD